MCYLFCNSPDERANIYLARFCNNQQFAVKGRKRRDLSFTDLYKLNESDRTAHAIHIVTHAFCFTSQKESSNPLPMTQVESAPTHVSYFPRVPSKFRTCSSSKKVCMLPIVFSKRL